ncbi:MAG: DNA methyltransferase, partial [Planctomycetota bacterium]
TQVHRVLKPSGAFWLAIGDEYAAELKVEAQKIGFHARSWVIWYYTFGVHCRTKFTRSHAHLFHFVKDPDEFTFNAQEVAVPSARQLVYGDKRANPKGRIPDDTWILRPQDCVDGFTPDEDVWYFARVAGTFKERAGFHGCQMPEQLIGRIVRSCSLPGEIVVDPFNGSGTTLTVAKKLGRKFFGFEMSKEYAKLGRDRIANAAVGDLLEGAKEPEVKVPATDVPKSKRVKNAPVVDHRGFTNLTFEFERIQDESESLLRAFGKSNRGFSVDRLVADPILNEDFQTQCDRLDVPGTPAERNRFLFRMRKAGHLKRAGIETKKRTRFDWNEMDPFLHAAEIAWRSVSELYADAGLDEILCDPRLAAKFDEVAGQFAAGYSALEYRWAALKLRKERHQIRARFDSTTPKSLGLRKFKTKDFVSLKKLDWGDLEDQPGVYAIRHGDDDFLYAGEAMRLRSRLSVQLAEAARAAWPGVGTNSGDLHVSVLAVPQIGDARLARQSRLLKWYKTRWNHHRQLAV